MHEPVTWETTYGQGRSIITSMGHITSGAVILSGTRFIVWVFNDFSP